VQKFEVYISEQAHDNLREITVNKIAYDAPSALKFFEGFYEDVKTLGYFPQRGFNLINNLKAKIYKNHLIIYQISDDKVNIIDIIDPKQHSLASKYY